MARMPASLEQWLDHIQSIHFRSLNLNLDRVRRVHHVLRLRRSPVVITIGGTNGKGSSASILESVFQSAGLRVGTYTSPHLINYQERIRIKGVNIEEAQLLKAFASVELARHNIPLTFFEFGTLAALWLFQQAAVNVAILEVGMGGRLDAVNIEQSDVALLTQIAIDHERWLGANCEEIGTEKAGIFRYRGHVVINDENPPDSVVNRAHFLRCTCLRNGHDYVVDDADNHWNWQPSRGAKHWVTAVNNLPKPSLVGKHQIANAAGVVAVLQLLPTHLEVPRSALIEGLRSQGVRGRLEIYRGPPETIVDVGHNLSAAECLVEFLRGKAAARRTLGVFSMLEDKPTDAVVRCLGGIIDDWHITELRNKRALSVVELERVIRAETTGAVHVWNSAEEAFYRARKDSEFIDRIIVFGSTYLAGAILKVLDNETTYA